MTTFYRVLDAKASQKGEQLLARILGEGGPRHSFSFPQERLKVLPSSPFAYWLGEGFRKLSELSPHEVEDDVHGKGGLSTGDDFRFVRTAWEVDPGDIVEEVGGWIRFAKGGEYQPYQADVHLVANWHEGARLYEERNAALGKQSSNVWMLAGTIEDFFFRPAITWPTRTTSGFGPKPLPRGCGFAGQGRTLQVPDEILGPTLIFLQSRVFRYFIESWLASGDAAVSGSAARAYEVGLVTSVPIPSAVARDTDLASIASDVLNKAQRLGIRDEVDHVFSGPLRCPEREWEEHLQLVVEILESTAAGENRLHEILDLTEEDLEELDHEMGSHPQLYRGEGGTEAEGPPLDSSLEDLLETGRETGGGRFLLKKEFFADRRVELLAHLRNEKASSVAQRMRASLPPAYRETFYANMYQFALGCVMGRWDVRMVADPTLLPDLQDPFAVLPKLPPATLVGPEGRAAFEGRIASRQWLEARRHVTAQPFVAEPAEGSTVTSAEYPISVAWNGIIVDDPGHEWDIIRKVREVLSYLYDERSLEMEEEALEAFRSGGRTPRTLRDWFRNQKASGLGKNMFDFHIQRYSKSRRKAPIYWRLCTSPGRGQSDYGVWLYYHRLTNDTLWTVLNQYIGPKRGVEERRLEELHSRVSSTDGAQRRGIESEIEGKESVLEELEWFESELRKVAERGYEPDRDDGVVINMAPLHSVVPWKEPEKIWKRLQKGEYDWSKLAMKYWPDRVRQKCSEDDSLALAHGLEEEA